ncbi:MAG TPA: hypothetical protein VFX60_10125 [Micromonospora sp.]|nr:hypothetical protein [Micromonospora sp.]
MAPSRRLRSLAAVAVLAIPLAGCSVIGDIRRPVPTHAPAPSSAAPTPAAPAPTRHPPVAPAEVRQASLPVPEAGYEVSQVEFADAEHGYALLSRCPGNLTTGAPGKCSALLFSTADGGRSWQRLHHSFREAAERYGLFVRGDRLRLAMGDVWYLSDDRGRSFARQSVKDDPPADYFGLVDFQTDEPDAVVRWVDGEAHQLASPPVPGLSNLIVYRTDMPVVHSSGLRVAKPGERTDWLVAAGAREGKPYAAVSMDGGQSWRRTPVPAPDGTLMHVLLLRSPDGELWMIGVRSTQQLFPHLWRLTGEVWVAERPARHPTRFFGVAPLGEQMLAIFGPDGSGVVSGGVYEDLGWPEGIRAQILDDGTLWMWGSEGDVWLGEGHTSSRRWVKIEVKAAITPSR